MIRPRDAPRADASSGIHSPATGFPPAGSILWRRSSSVSILPNRAPDDPTGANNFRGNDVTKLTRNNWVIKVDHNFSSKDKVTARYLYNSDDTEPNSVYANPSADTVNMTNRHQQYWYGT